MTTRSAPGPVMAWVPIISWPWLGRSRPASSFGRVDLPQPDGPTKQTKSPGGTSRVTLSSAPTVPPAPLKTLLTPRIRSVSVAPAPSARAAGVRPACAERSATVPRMPMAALLRTATLLDGPIQQVIQRPPVHQAAQVGVLLQEAGGDAERGK